MKIKIFLCIALLLSSFRIYADNTIQVSQDNGTAEGCLREALEKARAFDGEPVTIMLSPDIYLIPRKEVQVKKYYVSNTCSEKECADPQKHIALLLKSLENVTIDGQGSTILLDGELTTFIIDSCSNITLKNLKIDNIHPTMVEMTVIEDGDNWMKCKVHHDSQYRIDEGKLEWYGNGWSWGYGIAQMYDPEREITWRSWSPMQNLEEAREVAPGVLYLRYVKKPAIPVGTVFQIRDAIRDEVCGLINCSRNIRLENIDFYYMGNFSVVGQVSENIAFAHCSFAPKQGSGRTNSSFADMLHFSGCKGLIEIENCYFSGAHDDPINVHGTHLKIVEIPDRNHLRLRYMHPQTYGFMSFFEGDSIEIVNPNTLLAKSYNTVKSAKMLSPREIEVTLSEPLKKNIAESVKDYVVENTTLTPEVHIAGNYFCRVPTRGILVSTRRKAVIENNTFHGMQMSGVLVGDDGKSWFESGPVYDLTIRGNTFLECGNPVIYICPENSEKASQVHRNITISANIFEMKSTATTAISASSVGGLTITDNLIVYPSKQETDVMKFDNCTDIMCDRNRIRTKVNSNY